MIDKTKSIITSEIEEFIQDQFLNFKRAELHFQLKDLVESLNQNRSYTFDGSKIKFYLQYERNMHPSHKPVHYKLYYFNDNVKEDEITEITKKGRVYTFYHQDWLTQEQLKEFNTM